jgi:hypothetical protein
MDHGVNLGHRHVQIPTPFPGIRKHPLLPTRARFPRLDDVVITKNGSRGQGESWEPKRCGGGKPCSFRFPVMALASSPS